MQEEYLSREHVAALLGKTTATLDRWHARGFGPPRTEGVGYRRSGLDAWLAAKETPAASAETRAPAPTISVGLALDNFHQPPGLTRAHAKTGIGGSCYLPAGTRILIAGDSETHTLLHDAVQPHGNALVRLSLSPPLRYMRSGGETVSILAKAA